MNDVCTRAMTREKEYLSIRGITLFLLVLAKFEFGVCAVIEDSSKSSKTVVCEFFDSTCIKVISS